MDHRINIGEMQCSSPQKEDVDRILANSFDRNLTINELKQLSFSSKELWPTIIETANKIKKMFFKNNIYLYVPVYVSSVCVNDCLYCDFRRSNKGFSRKRLNFDEFKKEVNYLFEKGYKGKIELVSASDPGFPITKFAEYISYTKSLGTKEILMNNRVLNFSEYKLLKDAGLDWSWLWFESYNEEYFSKHHPKGGEKFDFKKRLDSYDDAAKAGLNIGIGVLLGLSPDWRLEILSAIAHGQYLKREYKTGIQFGTPRFCKPNNAPMTESPFPEAMQDDIFKLMIALYRLGIRDSYIGVSTRESIEMLTELWHGGGNLTNPEAKTIPGGYTLDTQGAQFSHNSYSLERFISEIKEQGLNPVY